MFNRARIILTLFYSAIFLACFWVFSFGLYAWMEKSFEVEVGEQMMQHPSPPGSDLGEIVIDINEKALDQLYFILVVLNTLFLTIIPMLSWFLTGQTLAPVQRAHEVQRQFVSDAAHELRTPLTIVQSEIEITLKKVRSADEYRAALASNRQEIIRLSELAERLLFLARHDDGQEQLVYASIDLTDLVGEVLAQHRTPLKEKDIALAFAPSEESVTVKGDRLLLARLFANLIDNAIKYTPCGGRIAATIDVQDAKASVEIADTGIGIAPDLHNKIFARFTRADASRGETKGYGVGLAICHAIAEKHGGTITVTSSPGQGSTFKVTLARTQST